ncbi:peptidoglycan-binding domain-containing protein [Streptomyces olivoreticuli]|uniref:peptidoglycan-binding domain-containing protein n=1 Tax=Streptomyces olivoreticuli TaxID=68246 RepID=UPI002659D1E0|nr:peptidoglycan-binding domain-containing protein [Streptomyces olivoreticuli]WKK24304.1 peptidoglycan-binding domain-containing protein [Streptomyces olivoreticuli]
MTRPPRKAVLGVASVMLVLAAGGGACAVYGTGGDGKPAVNNAPVTTAKVTRSDLVTSTSFSGTLTYASQRDLKAGAAGTVTARPPKAGDTIRRNQPLYEVDRVPVVLFHGEVPMYRELKKGVDGIDVVQLTENLRALGYDGVSGVGKFDAGTEAAVKRWQKRLGVEQTGVVKPEHLVFLPDEVRVADAKAQSGDKVEANAPVLTLSSAERVVTAQVEDMMRAKLKQGSAVKVSVPGAGEKPGRITKITLAAAESGADAPSGAASGGKPKATVEITLDGTVGPTVQDRLPVTVAFADQVTKDALTVPVEALVALREGGYGVQVVTGSAKKTVQVTPGTYADGKVELTGSALTEGTLVEVPSK